VAFVRNFILYHKPLRRQETPMLQVTPQARGAFTWKHGVFEVTCRPDAFAKLEKFAQRIGLKLEDLLEAKQKLDNQDDESPPVTITVRDETQAAFEGTQTVSYTHLRAHET